MQLLFHIPEWTVLGGLGGPHFCRSTATHKPGGNTMSVQRNRFECVFVLIFLGSNTLFGLAVGDRIKAAAEGANVRNDQLAETSLFIQEGGVHGTITGGPVQGTAGGFTGNWWKIRWDAQPPY